MKIFWKFYAILFCCIATANIAYFLSSESVVQRYYTVLLSFFPSYILVLELNALNLITTWFGSLVVLGYAFDTGIGIRAARWLFYLRIISECGGHSYELNVIKSGFVQSSKYGIILAATLIIPIIPSYVAHYLYIRQRIK